MPSSPTTPPPCCPVCDADMRRDVMADIWRCPACGYFGSTFAVAINEKNEALDEGRRFDALAAIRHVNFTTVLDRLLAIAEFPPNATALDVGCGHGWFLQALSERGHHASGVEPDLYIAEIARRAGHNVTVGFFPDALDAGARFDAIFFHDVFEHLPDVNGIVENLKRHTTDVGWVVVNLPVSGGIFFRIARLLAWLGITGPYRRLWQADMPSPHLSYFSAGTIGTLFAKHGFDLIDHGRLRSLTVRGLIDRIRYDRNINPLAAYFYYIGTMALLPVLALLPADIRFFAFRKRAPQYAPLQARTVSTIPATISTIPKI